MDRDGARQRFIDLDFSFSDLGSKEIYLLKDKLFDELDKFNNGPLTMKLAPLRLKDIKFNDSDGSIKKVFFMVNGFVTDSKSPIFKRREAISFNQGGFIGFCGWADKTNVQPFIKAFHNWLEVLEFRKNKVI